MFQIIFILFVVSFTYGIKAENLPPSSNSALDISADQPQSVPKFDHNNPQAKGVILSFQRWPNEQERKLLIKKIQAMGLKKTKEIELFKSWVLEWPGWKKGKEAVEVCNSLSNLSFLEYCEPEYLLGPAVGKRRKTPRKKKAPKAGVVVTPKDNSLNNEAQFPSNRSGDVKSCKIFSSNLGLSEGRLSDYWAQEMIGSDLLKKELEKLPPVGKHLVSVLDDTSERHNRHDVGVKNLISDEGKNAVLPELGDKINTRDVSRPSSYLENSAALFRKFSSKCNTGRGR